MTDKDREERVDRVSQEVFPDVVTDGRRALVWHVIETARPLIQQQVLRDMAQEFEDWAEASTERKCGKSQILGFKIAADVVRTFAKDRGIDL